MVSFSAALDTVGHDLYEILFPLEGLTVGLALAWQALYNWVKSPTPFHSFYGIISFWLPAFLFIMALGLLFSPNVGVPRVSVIFHFTLHTLAE